ncbi:MAG: hypothetical protein AAFZ18_11300 [Myxococcota bacterium]
MAVGIRGYIALALSETVANLQQVAHADVRESRDRVDSSKKKARAAKNKKRKRKWFGRTFLRGRDNKKIKKAEIEVQEQQLALGEAQRLEQGAEKMDGMVGQLFSQQFRDTLRGEEEA